MYRSGLILSAFIDSTIKGKGGVFEVYYASSHSTYNAVMNLAVSEGAKLTMLTFASQICDILVSPSCWVLLLKTCQSPRDILVRGAIRLEFLHNPNPVCFCVLDEAIIDFKHFWARHVK